jgi:lysophospholipase L1-like esterase
MTLSRRRFLEGTAVLALVLATVATCCCRTARGEDPNPFQARDDHQMIGVVGSSVAWGWLSSYKHADDFRNGYGHRLARLMRPRGWIVITKLSMPGDTTERVLERLEEDVFGIVDYAIIGLSLENERIRISDPDAIFKQYAGNLRKIVRLCRKNGVVPILGLCYANNNFEEEHYQYVKDMNLEINSWDVPSINLLGALDDGAGHYPNGYHVDLDHPNNAGYEEMFYAIVPSLFEALKAGKPTPEKVKGNQGISVDGAAGSAPLSFVPEDTMHSFATAFWVQCGSPGTIAVIEADKGNPSVRIGEDGKLSYVASGGETVIDEKKLTKSKWHSVVLSHRHAKGETLVFVDGEPIGTASEMLIPRRFILGGPGDKLGGAAPDKAEYRDWTVYRAALNADEARAIHNKKLLQASLEVYAPLSDASLEADAPVENRAQSTARVVAYPSQ